MMKTVLNCGYVPLVDCAPLIIAQELGFAAEEGIDLNLVQQPSWSALRDMLALGHLDAAQMLSPMPVAMSLGLGGLSAQIDALMVLSVNGTVFGLSTPLAQKLRTADHGPAFGQAAQLHKSLNAASIDHLRIGVPFHFSMHRLLLEYWLAASGQPDLSVDIVAVPPPRMSDAISRNEIDAFWVGEPWGSVAVSREVAELVLPGNAIWAFAPEKVLAARHQWVEDHPTRVRGLMRAVHQAARWLDTSTNKSLAVEILARSEHLNLAPDLIDPAISGQLSPNAEDLPTQIDRFLVFNKHAANFPWRSQAAWIARRIGAAADDIAKAKACFRTDLYRDNLGPVGVDLPGASEKIEGAMRHSTAVSSTRGHMILAPDAFFDGKTYENGTEK
ncbi:CmpA/NrtA family ABC transporter substrate-binding protein [uncultured Roseobacter sp.]|uniref:CmpA/NrtA family ABC transporter substrate-binding protein n=1 Tax=uncultured Roseobacter sp. TaxID=114847 RepID=UPI00261B769D|nr:CmpA/NrtA family ABC transporter substrate-binding protein [uncultured Roseobacter sp.]